MGGPGSGPRPMNANLYTVGHIERALPVILEALVAKASHAPCPKCGEPCPGRGSAEAAIYLIDRLLGHPKIEIDQRISTELRLTADDYALLARAAALEARVIQAAQLPPGEVIDVPARVVAEDQADGPDAPDSPPTPHSEAPADTGGTEPHEPTG